MKVKGIDFGSVFVASGTLNFFGEGWPYHKWYKMLSGFNFEGSTLIAKTATLEARAGNMPLDVDFMPRKFKPDCIRVNVRKGVVLNAVGLSNPGLMWLLQLNRWQKLEKPFVLSIMPVQDTMEKRIQEVIMMASMIANESKNFYAPFMVELNISCPNVEHKSIQYRNEYSRQLQALRMILPDNVPVMLKVNINFSVEMAAEFFTEKWIDVLDISNTIPWGQYPDEIDWQVLFGHESPLKNFGGGGLSGKPLLPLVVAWLKCLRQVEDNLPIAAGGGVLKPRDVDLLVEAGANAVSIGSVAILRPWRVKKIVGRAKELLEGAE